MNNCFITILPWMRTELDLKGNDLLVYAIIHGFSQDGESAFCGILSYLADWCGCTKPGIRKNLNHLIELGLIEKHDTVINGTSCHTYTTVLREETKFLRGKLSFPNNIYYTNTHYTDTQDTKIQDTKIQDGKGKKALVTKNLYKKCEWCACNFEFTGELREKVLEYLSLRLKMKDKPIYSVNQWKAILVKLTKDLAPNDPEQQLAIVKQSIERGYASFFPVSDYKKTVNNRRRVDKGVSCDQYTDEEKKEIKKWQEEVVKNGGRIKF
jgi:hypothetical protein